MFNYIIRRLLIALPVLLGVTFLNFVLINLAPGDPVDMYVNPDVTEEDKQIRREALGLNDPFMIRYFKWLANLLQGDLGHSFSSFQPVTAMIAERIGPTLLLVGASILFGYLIAIPIGIYCAVKSGSKFDYLMSTGSLLGVSIPNFFLGLGLIYIFGVLLGILPTGGMNSMGGSGGFWDTLTHLILPTITLGTSISGGMIRYVRSSVIEVLGQEYLRTARAKGMKEFIVINKHALKNALIPLITIAGLDIPILIGGAVITETIFQWNGMGQLTIQAIFSRDFPLLMGVNMLAALSVLAANLWSDVMYAVVDPRIKYS
ncbi:ABC transporter permease [Paenibacillus shunpengii]|uniref:ABC transporter permease n=1 Tax=Paenibacillus shunpengii TaxID=2054424 RepID=A0ABW5SL00_9BACL|nr:MULTISPECIES: ABC transporter permease [unclassified Paenibacillus]OMC70712.1 peptide permease [Paenibacillus sp. FSL H7-0326]SDW05632.1 peptide/nickel transport system permease protein [Paenibacillus sp. PDC88]